MTSPRWSHLSWIREKELETAASEEARMGSEVLRLAIAFDDLLVTGMSERSAREKLQYKARLFPNTGRYIGCLKSHPDDTTPVGVRVSDLSPGMILVQDVRTSDGMLIATKGRTITLSLMICFRNLFNQGSIADRLLILPHSAPPREEEGLDQQVRSGPVLNS